jgi:hypothetical protein
MTLKQNRNHSRSTFAWPGMGGRISGEMVQLIDRPLEAGSAETGAVAAPSVAHDRRRAGRVEQVSPALIPLLRDPAHYVDSGLDEDADPLSRARGVVIGSILSVPLWALMILGFWRFL